PGERDAAVHAQRLEHAVADEQSVIEGGDARGIGVDDRAVEPDLRVGAHERASAGASTPAARSNRCALSSVSSHSDAGSESATMPPPTPRCVWPPVTVNVRIATARSPS